MAPFKLLSGMGINIPIPRFLRGVPVPALRIISLLIVINIIVWIAAGIVAHYNPGLIGAAALSFALGLRHALDADHISAIDLMTRRLIASGQQPVTVGTWFSLGHSTIVVVTCIVVAATSGALRDKFDDFTRVGNIIGTSVSAAFLLLLSVGNAWVLYKLVKRLQELLARQRRIALGEDSDQGDGDPNTNGHLGLDGVGFMSRVFRKLFVIVDKPWKMFPLGLMFGLGFDTSSEIAILGIASIHGAQGTSLWVILIFPALFTGMCFCDRPLRCGLERPLTSPQLACVWLTLPMAP
jgi:high-affinity nickel-transport protein